MRIGLLILLSLAAAFAPSASALACGHDHVFADAGSGAAGSGAAGSGAAEFGAVGDSACCCVKEPLPCSCSSCLENLVSGDGDVRQGCLCGHTAPQNTSTVATETVVETVRLASSVVAERGDCPTYGEAKQSRAIELSNSHPEVRLPLLL